MDPNIEMGQVPQLNDEDHLDFQNDQSALNSNLEPNLDLHGGASQPMAFTDDEI